MVIFAPKTVRNEAIRLMGKRSRRHYTQDPNLQIHSFTVSNQDIAGKRIADIPLFDKFKAQITQVRRANDEFVGAGDAYLELGDVVEVVSPLRKEEQLEEYFGDSVTSSSELNWVATAGGLDLGFLAALITIPLPGGTSFALGAAAGPLIVGTILGAVQRTAHIPWQLPRSANMTMRQFGLMLFLAAVGVASGPAFASTAFSIEGLKAILLGIIVLAFAAGSLIAIAKFVMQRSAPRAAGTIGGLMGQPAVLSFAMSRSSDGRIMSGYSTTFAVALIAKIVIVPFMFS